MSLEPTQPPYRQIASRLRHRIELGTYPPGTAMPPEEAVAAEFGVNRLTAMRALKLLRAEGMIHVQRGIGTVVREIPEIRRSAMIRYRKAEREAAGGRGAFDSEIRRLGYEPRSDVEVAKRRPPRRVADTFGIDAEAVMRQRRMYASGTPVQFATSWIPAAIADGTALAEQDSGPGGIVSRFAELGYEQTRVAESITTRRAEPEEASFLRLDDDAFVTEIYHVAYAAENLVVEVCIHVLPAYLWRLDYEWRIDEQA